MATKPDDSAPRFHQNFLNQDKCAGFFCDLLVLIFLFLFYFSKGVFTEGLQQQKFAMCLLDKF